MLMKGKMFAVNTLKNPYSSFLVITTFATLANIATKVMIAGTIGWTAMTTIASILSFGVLISVFRLMFAVVNDDAARFAKQA